MSFLCVDFDLCQYNTGLVIYLKLVLKVEFTIHNRTSLVEGEVEDRTGMEWIEQYEIEQRGKHGEDMKGQVKGQDKAQRTDI